MNLIEKFVTFTYTQIPEPTLFGLAHISWLIIGVIATVIMIITCKNLSEKKLKTILLSVGCSLLFLEAIKQLHFAYEPATDTWDYAWKQFPFQFCSTPMYVMVVAALLKEGKLKSSLYSFLATYGLFAGLVVSLYPATVLSDIIFRFSQSMVHHIAMFIIGVLMYVSGKVEFKHKTIVKAIPVFASCAAVAFSMNIIFHLTGNTDSFNMFYIGPYSKCDIPVLSTIGEMLHIESEYLHLGNFAFLVIYTVGFSLIAYIVLLVAMLIKRISKRGE